jgi:hypothetical protein
MKLPPRLRLEPRPSKIAALAALAGTIATALLALVTFADALACAIAVLSIGALGLRAVRRLGNAPLLLQVGADRRISVTASDGRTHEGAVRADSSVGAWLTTLIWVPDGGRWCVPAPAIVVLADSLPKDDFRRLRVYLRYGREASARDTRSAAPP